MNRFLPFFAALATLSSLASRAESQEITPILAFQVWPAGEAPQRAEVALAAFVKAGAKVKLVDNGATVARQVSVDEIAISISANSYDTEPTAPCYGRATYQISFLDRNSGKKVNVDELKNCKAHVAKDLIAALGSMTDGSLPYAEHMHSDVITAVGKRIKVERLDFHDGRKPDFSAEGVFCLAEGGDHDYCAEVDRRKLVGQSSESGLRDDKNGDTHFTDPFTPIVEFEHDGAAAKALFDALVSQGARSEKTYEGDVLQVDNVSLTIDDGYVVPGFETPCYAKKGYAFSLIDRQWDDKTLSVDETSECTATKAASVVNAFLPLGALRVFRAEDRLGRVYAQAYGVKVVHQPASADEAEAYSVSGSFCESDYCSLVR